jgi:hypothetical protein
VYVKSLKRSLRAGQDEERHRDEDDDVLEQPVLAEDRINREREPDREVGLRAGTGDSATSALIWGTFSALDSQDTGSADIMSEHATHTHFPGRLIFIGFGSIGQGVLPLILRHVGGLTPDRITIVTADDAGSRRGVEVRDQVPQSPADARELPARARAARRAR